jgi:hypothetical protein
MSFVNQQIQLKGATRPVHQLKLCAKCEEKKPPEGGIHMSQTRWMCASCWTVKATRRGSK